VIARRSSTSRKFSPGAVPEAHAEGAVGGQRQRVANRTPNSSFARYFCCDEPLSNLDAALRGQTRVEIAKLHRGTGCHHDLRHS